MRAMADAAWAFRRYHEIRERLPAASFPGVSERVADLGDITDRFDVFVFDSFGVLNVGETQVPGAVARVAALRGAGKKVFVLTNASSVPLGRATAKYAALGFDFAAPEIVMSRALLENALAAERPGMRWAVAAPESAAPDELPGDVVPLDDAALTEADGFILLSSHGWTDARQDALSAALVERPRPVLIGNPDLVAPREDGFTLQPGAYAHALTDATGVSPVFFGKPYANAFDALLTEIGPGTERRRILMLGDTLHTDILGAAAAGMASALVTGHGVLRGMDIEACIAQSGIRPDYILAQI
ncbi:MAG: HAD-IIA family hydrolase [Rhodospirillales bacterium]|nr:HAD-IIA family hydrolase [Rhodospirillales bacterium]MBO6785941.1 HAD-IIA family hydrolase [Rhodospirillales bacterium]